MTLTNNYFSKQQLVCFSQNIEYSKIDILKLWHHLLKITTQIFLLFLIISKFLFIFFTWIISNQYLDTRLLWRGLYILETFLDGSRTFLNIGFWARLSGRPSKIIISTMAIVRQVSSEVIIFWEFSSIPKTSEPYERLFQLLSNVIFDT